MRINYKIKGNRILLAVIFQFFIAAMLMAESKIKNTTVDDHLIKISAEAKQQGKQPNHLIFSQSPYLLQHAYNPVNWYRWGEAAFTKAKKENKPIFLSIGYSTCHWCHVMAKESFENNKIANYLNKNFISIKVDREQRPDIDSIYMAATQLISGSGGWPMTVFINHQLQPFHAGTYYRAFSSATHLGFYQVLTHINDLWVNQQALVKRTAKKITRVIRQRSDETAANSVLEKDINKQALSAIKQRFDPEFGGFSHAPKFPNAGFLAFLNQMIIQTNTNKKAINNSKEYGMLKTTLDGIATGGIYDQIAGGFHRYSVDSSWQVPHFEKMLYSQGLMSLAYTHFYQNNPEEKYKKIVYQTLKFLNQEMRAPKGGYYSALDADSERIDKKGEHAEGAYYLWKQTEIKRLLSKEAFAFIKKYYHIRENGNIYSDPNNEFTNLNILYVDEEYKNEKLTFQQKKLLHTANKKLADVRRLRPRPTVDDKIITAWNAMIISAFAQAATQFKNPLFLEQAIKTANFIKNNLYDKKAKKLFRQYRKNRVQANASLADYAWLIKSSLDIYQANKAEKWLQWALALQALQQTYFYDKKSGAYYLYANEPSRNSNNSHNKIKFSNNLLFRAKTIYDGAEPSPNSITLENLYRFSSLVSTTKQKQKFLKQAKNLVKSFALMINKYPLSATMMLAINKKYSNKK